MEDLRTRLNKIVKISEYRFKSQVIKKIIENVKSELSQINVFDQAIQIDSKRHFVNLNQNKVIEIIDEFSSLENDYIKFTPAEIVDGLGNIAVYYDGDPYVTLKLALMALRTHNNIVFFTKNYFAINSKIVEMINLVCKNEGYISKFSAVEYDVIDAEIFQNQFFFNVFIYIGDKRIYQSIKKRLSIPDIYCGYGNVDVFVEDKSFKDLLLDINKFSYENGINVNYYNNTSLEETLMFLNKYDVNDCCVLLSKNTEIIYRFISQIRAKNVYVNKNPFENYQFTISEKDLVYKKSIIMK